MTHPTFATSSIFALIFALLTVAPAEAQPVGSVDLMFSTDGGGTFADAATVDESESFLMRIYFDNTGDAPGTSSSVSMTLPAGFVRTGSSTRLCVEPTDGEIVCSEDLGQSGAIDEASVWSGQDLTISPTAGLFGSAIGATSGLLEIGKLAFINLHDCHYFNGAERFYTTADPDIAGTNISGSIDAAAACAGTVGAYGNAGQELRSAGLLAQRYLNYHECHYNFFTDHIYKDADGTATQTSNNVDAAFNCAGTAGAHILHPDSAVVNFDLFGNRYLNLWECRYISGGDLISLNTVGSNTSNTPDAGPSCPATFGAYTLNDSDHLALDTLDATRGRGFVEFEVAADSSGAGDFDLDADLSAAEFATETDTGTVTVNPGAAPIGSVDVMFSTDGGTSFFDTATVDELETFLMRIYFDNTGDAPGTSSSVSMTLPAGFVRTGSSTRLCVEPTDGEIVCSEDVGQSGAIDESSVWSGQDLTISPTAGLFDNSTGATSGLLEIGKLAFLNLHDCHYFNGAERFYTTADPDIAGTNVANSLDAAAACAGTVGAYGNAGQELRSAGLLGLRYLNYHECHYNFFTDHIYKDADGTATQTSNNVDAAFNCAGTAGAHILHPDSTVVNFDLFGNRYLNLWECRYISGGDLISLNTVGSNTSNTPDAGPSCPATFGAYTLNDSDHLALDTLDASRGRGFVELEVAAVTSGAGDFDVDSDLSAAEFTTETDTGTVTVVALPTDADMSITKDDGVTSAVPGQDTVTYTIVAANNGPSDDPSVSVSDTFPAELTCTYTSVAAGGATGNTAAGAGDLAETLSMPNGSSVTYTVSCTIDPGATGTLSNTATISGSLTDPDNGNNLATDGDTVLAPEADIAVTKDDGVTSAVPGQDTVTYTIIVSNNGPSDDPSVSVSDTFPAELTCTYTSVAAGGATGNTAAGSGDLAETLSLPAGSSVTYTADCTIDPAATGTLSNTATISGSISDPDAGNDSATDDDTVLTPEADLSVTKVDIKDPVAAGTKLIYTVSVTNAGPSVATGVIVTDTLPAGVALMSTTGCAEDPAGVPTCTLGTLGVGASADVTVRVAVDSSTTGVITNNASVTSDVTDPNGSDNATSENTTIISDSDIVLNKTDGLTEANPGDEVTYTITVAKAGPSDAPGTTVSDTFPAALTGVTWTCSASPGSSCTAAGSGDISDVADLVAGGEVTYLATGTIDADFLGTLENSATATPGAGVNDGDLSNNTDSDTTEVTSPANVSGTMVVGGPFSLSEKGAGDFAVGDVVAYTVTLMNSSPSAQFDNPGHELVVELPILLALLSASADSGVAAIDTATNTATWDGAIPGDGAVVITVEARIAYGSDGQTIVNQGTIFYDADGDGTNEASAVTDDPGATGSEDPTVIEVLDVVEIPTLGGAGMLLLVIGVALGGMARLRSRRLESPFDRRR